MGSLLKFTPVLFYLNPWSWFDDRIRMKKRDRLDRFLSVINQPDPNQNDTQTSSDNIIKESLREDEEFRFSLESLSEVSIEKLELTEFELVIISSTVDEIVSNIGSRKSDWNCKNVIKAFIKSAIGCQLETNCLSEIMFKEAIERAEELDKYFALTGQLKGRLHGIPISLKDQIDIEGFDSTIGFTRLIGKPARKSSSIFEMMIEEGAIPFTKTNVPQTMFSFECSNPIFGTTYNPHRKGFTAGGSSGGEAALLAADGSCIGIGSDVGGSLRIPAHYCGCYSLKPCNGRIAQTGLTSPSPGFRDILSSIGPMTRCYEDLVTLTRVLLDRSSNPTIGKTLGLIPLENFRDEIFDQIISEHHETQQDSSISNDQSKNIKFGYFTSDPIFDVSKPCQRAVLETVEALSKSGYDCVEIDVNRLDILEGAVLFVALTSGDGYETLLSQLDNDKMEASLFLTTLGPNLPSFLRFIIWGLIKFLIKDEVMSKLVEASRKKSLKEIYALRMRKDDYCFKVRSYLWDELKLDGLICPTQAVPAVPVQSTWNKSFLAISTFIWNVIDSSVGQIPITRVDPIKDNGFDQVSFKSRLSSSSNLDTDPNNHTIDSIRQEKIKSKPLIDKAVESLTGDLDRLKGLPVGVQLVCGIWEEEKVLGLMGIIEKALKENRRDQLKDSDENDLDLDGRKRPGDFLRRRRNL